MQNPVKIPKKLFRELQIHTAKVKKTSFSSRDGETLAGKHYIPKGEKRGTILFLHGVNTATSAEHYRVLLHRLVKAGFEVFAYDQRGHGKTEADFDVDKMQDDVVDVLKILKKRGVDEVSIAGHSLGAVVSMGGLLRAVKRKSVIPQVTATMFYAPPRKMNKLQVIKRVFSLMRSLREKRSLPLPLQRVAASVYMAFTNPRLDFAGKLLHAARGLTAFRRIKADEIRLRDFHHFEEEINKVPNFVSLVKQLRSHNALPPTFVFLGSRDSMIETHNPVKMENYRSALRRAGANVFAVPFVHEPPVISVAGEKDMFEISDLLARHAVRLTRKSTSTSTT